MGIRINSKELIEILESTPAEQNIMLTGRHGIGKSQILEKYFTEKGQKVIILFLGQMSDPGDLIGLPHIDEKSGKTEFIMPYWWPSSKSKPVVLFLDELNRARPEVLQTVMDLTLNRKLAGKALPKGSRIISAVNEGDEYQLTDLDPALVSRFNIYEFRPTVDEWLDWAKKEKLDNRVIDFINENPDMLDGDEFKREDQGLVKTPDRRGWERVSGIIKKSSKLKDVHKKQIAGIVGIPAASKFFAVVSERSTLSAKTILTGDILELESKIVECSTPELAIINESLYKFIEAKSYKESEVEIIKENFECYFDLLKEDQLREAQAHFVNLFVSGNYPICAKFVVDNCPALSAKFMTFVSTL